MKTSWVIVNKFTNEVVMETYQDRVLFKLNLHKYKAIPIKDWLSSLNKKETL